MKILAGISATTTLLFAGALAGLFFAYSVSVMAGLDAIKPDHAIAAMRSINVKIQNPLFLLVFMLMPVVGAVAGVLLLVLGQRTAGLLFLISTAAYVVGVLVPSFAVNIPMNDTLDAARPSASEMARVWADYSSRWTAWNHLRTVFSLVSMMLAGAGLFVWGRDA